MNKTTIKILLVLVLVLILAVELIFTGFLFGDKEPEPAVLSDEPTEETRNEPEKTVEEPTEEPTQAPTKPRAETFTLTFVGDCTLGSSVQGFSYGQGFLKTIGEDYEYPFRNVIDYFAGDDFTMLNLEGALCDEGAATQKEYNFRGPTVYTNILTMNSVDAVTIANNHTYDFGQKGYDSTTAALSDAGVPYVEDNNTLIITTENGLTIGIYAATYAAMTEKSIVAGITALRENPDVELIIFAAHWGNENSYRSSERQQMLGYAAIDAGANIVYGTHPHVLQPIEEYNGGIIYYSLGNFSFGGNNKPKDFDTALIQQVVIRDPDGTIRLGGTIIVPCSISSVTDYNNFQPTPYTAGSERYLRVLEKLSGEYRGANLPIG